MTQLWQRSLLFRTVTSIIAITVIIGSILVIISSQLYAKRAQGDAYNRLGELIDTVESTVQIACFVGDAQLATEVARGLLKTREVSGVTIRSDKGDLVTLDRQGVSTSPPTKNGEPLHRQIISPFDSEHEVGAILVYPDNAAIEEQVNRSKLYITLQIIILITAVAIALTLTALRLVIRPISKISKHMHSLNAEKGETLVPPRSHENNLIGSLTRDINTLIARLVETINTEHRLRVQHEIDQRKYRDIFENAESGIFIADQDGQIKSYNRWLSQLTGLPQPETNPLPQRSLLDVSWDNKESLRTMLANALEHTPSQEMDFELHTATGVSRWLNLTITALGANLIQGIVTDVTSRRMAEDKAQRLAVTDALTGLPNRLGFEQHVLSLLNDTPSLPFTLIIADLDGFREINDAMGFPAGDKLLIGVATRVVDSLKLNDRVARLSGDDFAILLPSMCEIGAIEKIAKRIIQQCNARFSINDQNNNLRMSIGITLYPRDGHDLPTLMRNAELALAQAQASGGNTWRMFQPSMIQAIETRHHLANDLHDARERNELRLFYQPIIDIQVQRVIGAECLIRWQHPQHGLIPPDNFIPLAEETGSINDIGLWCLETASRQLQIWDQQGLPLNLTVNVSARQIPDGLSAHTIHRTLTHYGLTTGRIGLEITESTLAGDNRVPQWVSDLRMQGSRIYLDDFGTGYSSLSYLKRFKVDTIKIDKAFVRDLAQDSNDRVMVEAVTMMADSLHLSVVAEGIETQEQLALLRQMGCRYGQGYYFSKPVPPDLLPEAIERINRGNQAPLI